MFMVFRCCVSVCQLSVLKYEEPQKDNGTEFKTDCCMNNTVIRIMPYDQNLKVWLHVTSACAYASMSVSTLT